MNAKSIPAFAVLNKNLFLFFFLCYWQSNRGCAQPPGFTPGPHSLFSRHPFLGGGADKGKETIPFHKYLVDLG